MPDGPGFGWIFAGRLRPTHRVRWTFVLIRRRPVTAAGGHARATHTMGRGRQRRERSVPIFERLLRAGEGRTLRRLKAISDAVNSIEENYTDLTEIGRAHV